MADYNAFQENFADFILSASGFRKIFARDGNEESFTESISSEDAAAAAVITAEFARLLKSSGGSRAVLAVDARPTGPSIAKVAAGVLSEQGIDVLYTGITAAPELMAWVKTSDDIGGFAYISASHNPVGHNGFKFGLSDGAVIGGETAKQLISSVIAAAVDEDVFNRYSEASDIYSSELPDPSANKKKSEEAYREFSLRVISAEDDSDARGPLLERLRKSASGTGILAELNGSARGTGIDRDFLQSFGMKTLFINDSPGQMVHAIVPEGSSLDLCRSELEKAHAQDPSFVLGYVPDNDGDRGNIVYINSRSGRALILEAQEVFALSVKSELEYIRQLKPEAKCAVVVNGPTSMRIERIAEDCGAMVFRAEVGEANAVSLAAEKRGEGYEVRILGEGSNGGNITHPASVRDPLNTIFALLKLTAFCGYGSLTDAVESLPPFTTTSAYEPEAKMQIGSISHADLKANYERIFPAEFEKKKKQLKADYGITGWYEINYEGTSARKGTGPDYRSGRQSGGLKIMLVGSTADSSGIPVMKDIGFLWMRGSGTEPVFRVMTDIEGNNPKGMTDLLQWHRGMVAEAAGLSA